MQTHEIVIIEGDGIGKELTEASLFILKEIEKKIDSLQINFKFRDAGARFYELNGTNISHETLEDIRQSDALLKGPVGLPHVRFSDGTEAGLLGGVLRNGLDVFANVRPIKLLPGVEAPLKALPGEIDYVIVRENTEGLYLSRGRGVGNDSAMTDTLMITRKGTERVIRFAFDLARRRSGSPKSKTRRVTCVDKSNVLASFALFREIFYEVASEYPDIEHDCMYADAAAQALVMSPSDFDVLVMENFLGDILSDLGGGTIGGIGLCPSGNIGGKHAYFEPIHGSAPDIEGQDLANPISQILSAGLMLDYLGEHKAAELLSSSLYMALDNGELKINATGQPERGTRHATEAIANALLELY